MVANIPDVHAFDRVIPAGKVLLAEYGQVDGERRPERTVLDRKTGWGRVDVELVAVTAGWAIAGSMLRWDNGHFGVFYWLDGAKHGSRHKTLAAALEHFNRIPTRRYGDAA